MGEHICNGWFFSWGFRGTMTAMGGIGGTVRVSSSGIIGEIQGGPNVQLGLTLGYTWYVGQIG